MQKQLIVLLALPSTDKQLAVASLKQRFGKRARVFLQSAPDLSLASPFSEMWHELKLLMDSTRQSVAIWSHSWIDINFDEIHSYNRTVDADGYAELLGELYDLVQSDKLKVTIVCVQQKQATALPADYSEYFAEAENARLCRLDEAYQSLSTAELDVMSAALPQVSIVTADSESLAGLAL